MPKKFKNQISNLKKKQAEIQQNVNYLQEARDSIKASSRQNTEFSPRPSNIKDFSETKQDGQDLFDGSVKNIDNEVIEMKEMVQRDEIDQQL